MGKNIGHTGGNRCYLIAYDFSSDRLRRKVEKTLLDYGNRIMVMNILENLKKDGYTILISSHNPQDAFLYADEVIILNEGKVKVQGPPNDVLTSELLSSIYKQNIELIDIKEKNIKICIPIMKGETKWKKFF